MVAKCVIGACIAFLCATPVLGEEGNGTHGIQLAKFVEQSQPLPKQQEIPPQVKVKEVFDYYDIDGTTPDELRAQMKRNGTAWNDGRVYAALTTWDIHYHYDITSSNGGYALSAIGTDVDIVIHFPRLKASAKTSQQLTASWNTYLENLKTHEFGHRDLAIGIGQEIYQALSSLGSSASKSDLDREAQRLVKAKFQKLKEVQVAYDVETHHGKKQGAVLQDPMLAAIVPATGERPF
jgi:predicted secreted Zn-dependent protease